MPSPTPQGGIRLHSAHGPQSDRVRKAPNNDEADEMVSVCQEGSNRADCTNRVLLQQDTRGNDVAISTTQMVGEETSDDILASIWDKNDVSSKEGRIDAIQRTRGLLEISFAELMQSGKKAHLEWARVQQELDLANEYIVSKSREIERLRAPDTKNRENISKLLQTVTSTNKATKQQSQANVSDVCLRSELLQTTKALEEAKRELAQSDHKCKRLEKDLRGTKAKLAQEQQTKQQMKRDQQAAKSLTTALHGVGQSNVDYYKRKVTELQTHVQGLQGILAERNREIESLQREKDRLLTQNQQLSSRHSAAKGTKRSRR